MKDTILKISLLNGNSKVGVNIKKLSADKRFMEICDLIYLNPQELETVVKEVSDTDLLQAMITLPDEVNEKLFSYLPLAVKIKFKERKVNSTPIHVSVIKASQEKIVIEMRKLFVK